MEWLLLLLYFILFISPITHEIASAEILEKFFLVDSRYQHGIEEIFPRLFQFKCKCFLPSRKIVGFIDYGEV
jgi:hypothetical protein